MESVSGTPYQYPSLDVAPGSFSFRLLLIQRAVSLSDPLVCTLVNEPFPPSEPYDCISYVWGTDAPSMRMSLDGFEVLIRENLWNGLKRLRRKDKERRLWADAICVNQNDIRERNSQVARMRDVYAGAKTVAMWLGEKVEENKHRRGTKEFVFDWIEAGGRLRFDPSDASSYLQPLFTNEDVVAEIDEFNCWFESPWWTRIWILQEAAVCRREPLLFYGEEMISWKTVGRFLRLVQKMTLYGDMSTLTSDQRISFGQLRTNIKDKYTDLATIRDRYQAQTDQSLSDLFTNSVNHCCTDPKDRYFALLGLTTPTCPIGANYNLSLEDISTIYSLHVRYPDRTHDELCEMVEDERARPGKQEAETRKLVKERKMREAEREAEEKETLRIKREAQSRANDEFWRETRGEAIELLMEAREINIWTTEEEKQKFKTKLQKMYEDRHGESASVESEEGSYTIEVVFRISKANALDYIDMHMRRQVDSTFEFVSAGDPHGGSFAGFNYKFLSSWVSGSSTQEVGHVVGLITHYFD